MTRLGTLRARDIMRKDVTRLAPTDPVETAVATFEELHIGGAPVVDEAGHLVGVLTASDIAQTAHVRGGRIETGGGEYTLPEPVGEELDESSVEEDILGKEDYSPEVLGGETVADWMNPEVVSVGPEATLRAVCLAMVRQRIHRVFVLDAGALVGVISTLDVVRCIAEDS
jgi:CBS domain-containing protein